MNRTAAKTYMSMMCAFSTAVAFIGTLTSDGIKDAFLIAVFVALLFVLTGAVGLRVFWENEERGK